MTLAEIIAQYQNTPRTSVSPQESSRWQKFFGREYKEPDVAADSLGTMDLMKRLDAISKQGDGWYDADGGYHAANGSPNIQPTPMPTGRLGVTMPYPQHMSDPDIMLAPTNASSPIRWQVLNHELGHYLSNYQVPEPEFPKSNDAPVGEYARTSEQERTAQNFSQNLHNRFLQQVMAGLNQPKTP